MKEKVLLHSCCGPCSTAVIEKLKADYDVTVFYFNPNIHPEEEYQHRKQEQQKVCQRLGVPYLDGEYNPQEFFSFGEAMATEPEGGARCKECFFLRMRKTAELAKEQAYDYFDTTLSVSPHKNYDVISQVGETLEKELAVKYLGGNYKKQDGYKRSIELSKEYGLYRQNYCGCIYSNWNLKEK